MDIGERLARFYDDILDRVETEHAFAAETTQNLSVDQRRNLYHQILTLVSILGMMEIPVPAPFIHECLRTSEDNYHRNVAVTLVERLKNQGHLVTGHSGSLSLPHLTIAGLIPAAFRLSQAELDLDHLLQSTEAEAAWPNEQAIIALFKFMERTHIGMEEAARTLAGYLATIDRKPSRGLLLFLASKPKELGFAMADVSCRRPRRARDTLVLRWIGEISPSSAVTVMAQRILSSKRPSYVIGSIHLSELRQHPEIKAALMGSAPRIAQEIRDSKKPSKFIESLRDLSELWEHPEIKAALIDSAPRIARRVRSSNRPWRIIKSLRYCPELCEHVDIKEAVISAIRTPKKAVSMIQSMDYCQKLWEHADIRATVIDAIRRSKKPSIIIQSIHHLSELQEHPEIEAAVTDSVPRIAQEIRDSKKPWQVVLRISHRLELQEHADLAAALRTVMPAIVSAILLEQVPSQDLEELFKLDDIRNDQEFQDAIKHTGLLDDAGLERRV